jgi:salicylate hydroxylase
MFHRADLHQTLADAVHALKPDAIHLDARAVGVAQDATRVTLTLADGVRATGDALIGADGVHSVVRAALFGADAPRFTGCMAWRGVIPMARLPQRLAGLVGTNWIGPGGHVVHYPLRRGELFNFVGIVERDDWRIESWNQRGTVKECAADFRLWHDDIHAIIRNIETPYKWALMMRDPLVHWSRGRVSLLGDAAHPTLPMLAQGAVMAIEDGFVLARALVANADIATALLRYEAARAERTARIVRGAADNVTRFHNPLLADPEEAAKYVDAEWREDRVRSRYEWLFTYDATTVPV